MVKDLSSQRIEYRHGRIRISVDKIVDIIEAKNFSKITSTSGHFEFESLDDIKRNKPLLAGQPRIYCDGIIIDFSRYGGNVYLSWNGGADASAAKSVSIDIKSSKTIIDRIYDNSKYIWILYIFIFSTWIISNYLLDFDKFDEGHKLIIQNAFFIFLIIHMIFVVNGIYVDLIRQPVYYRRNETFLNRNFEKIILSLISAIIGAAVAYLFGRVLG